MQGGVCAPPTLQTEIHKQHHGRVASSTEFKVVWPPIRHDANILNLKALDSMSYVY